MVCVGIVVPPAFQTVPFLCCFLEPRSSLLLLLLWSSAQVSEPGEKKRWVEMSIGNCQRWSSVCRASAAIRVKKCTGNTACWVSVFSFLPSTPVPSLLLLYCWDPCKEGRNPASSLRLPLLIFLLHRLLDIWSMNFFSCKIVTAGVSYSPKWQRSLFLEPGVRCWIDVIIAQPPSQLALMGN